MSWKSLKSTCSKQSLLPPCPGTLSLVNGTSIYPNIQKEEKKKPLTSPILPVPYSFSPQGLSLLRYDPYVHSQSQGRAPSAIMQVTTVTSWLSLYLWACSLLYDNQKDLPKSHMSPWWPSLSPTGYSSSSCTEYTINVLPGLAWSASPFAWTVPFVPKANGFYFLI